MKTTSSFYLLTGAERTGRTDQPSERSELLSESYSSGWSHCAPWLWSSWKPIVLLDHTTATIRSQTTKHTLTLTMEERDGSERIEEP